ncbi:MAG: hypothetical protein GC161_02020 [Planctomycetaceae bacterium]|nr:hypothetical protein [Planctomycetaceae bacterium]
MQRAAKLCTAAELQLVKDSAPRAIRALTPKQVASKLERARRLRDKQRDLLQRQSLRTRARTGSKHGKDVGPQNERTAQKHELFGEVVERFQARLEAIEQDDASASPSKSKSSGAALRPAKRAAKKAAKRVKKAGTRAAAKTRRKVSIGARGSSDGVDESKTKRSGIPPEARVLEQKIHAHVSSRTRRNQARRDQR